MILTMPQENFTGNGNFKNFTGNIDNLNIFVRLLQETLTIVKKNDNCNTTYLTRNIDNPNIFYHCYSKH